MVLEEVNRAQMKEFDNLIRIKDGKLQKASEEN